MMTHATLAETELTQYAFGGGDLTQLLHRDRRAVGHARRQTGLLRLLPPHWASTLHRGYRWGLGRPSQIPLAVLFALTVGYREEFFFRAYLLRRLDQAGMPSWAAIALSTALFSAGHIYEGIIGIALAACLGALFSIAYLRQRSLHVVAIGHGLYNALALCLGLFDPFSYALGAR